MTRLVALSTADRRFGKLVAKARKASGLTQKQLTDACGMKRSAISLIEVGAQHLRVIDVEPIAKALGEDPADLLGLGYDPSAPK